MAGRPAPVVVASTSMLVAAIGVAVAAAPTLAQDAAPVELALIAQDFAIAPNAVVHLEYELTGSLPEPPPTTTATTTPRSTPAPPTTPSAAADATTAADDATTAAAPRTSTTRPTAASTTTVAPPVDDDALTVLVTALDPIDLRSDVAAVLDGRPRAAIDSAEYDLADVLTTADSAPRQRLVLDVQTATRGEVRGELVLPRAGLYPVRVEIRQRRRILTRHVTFVERLATPDSGILPRSTLNLSIVAAIPDPGPEPDALDVVASNAKVTELAQLGETIAAPLTVSVPPVVASNLGDEQPSLAARLRDALTGDEALALPLAQLDPSSAVAAGQAEAFTRQLRDGEDVLRRALPSTAIRRIGWLADVPLSATGASMLRDLGVQILVAPFDTYLALDSELSTAARADLTDPTLLVAANLPDDGELPVTVVDPIMELLAPERDDDATPAEIAAHLFADLMAMRIQLGPDSRSIVLASPDLAIPDTDVLAVIEDFVDEHPDVGFQALSFVPGSTGQFVVNDEWLRVSLPETAGVDLSARVPAIDIARLHMEHVATMLPADDERPPAWRAELESLVSTGLGDDEVTRRLAAVERSLTEIEQAIRPPAPFTFTLGGDSTTITLRVANAGDTPLRVGVRISGPSRLTFPEPDTEVLLAADAITDVTIPIRARSNGTSEVTVELHTPSGSVIGDPIVLTARVNALSGLGQLLTGAALLVLATWWFSHFRRTRRNRLLLHSGRARDGHPSNRRARRRPQPAAANAGTSSVSTGVAAGGDSPNGHEVSPDAAVAATSPDQTDG